MNAQTPLSEPNLSSTPLSSFAPGDVCERGVPLEVATCNTSDLPQKSLLPNIEMDDNAHSEGAPMRREILLAKRQFEQQRARAFRQTRGMPASQERNDLYKEIQACTDEEHLLEQILTENFVPQHGASQFLSPRAFFVSPLFRVRGRSIPREPLVEFNLPILSQRLPIRYCGPELRQSDGRVFLTLVHMLRDVQVGTLVRLDPQAVCLAIFGRYDGTSRKALREHIQRLQKGLIVSAKFSVQLCLGFDYPQRGGWTVALHQHIVELFRVSPEVWLPMEPRLALSDGLATWLLTYVESQTRLIPLKISTLREQCGSESGERAFTNSLRLALGQVAQVGVIDSGWSVRNGQVRWQKARCATNDG